MNNFFDELRVVERKAIIELKSIYGLSPLRDIWSGDVTANGTEYIIAAPAGGGTGLLDSAERGPYPPGQEVEPGAALRLPAVPTGGQIARIGYYDAQDGWFFEYTADGLYTVVRRAGADTRIKFGSWSGDLISRDTDTAFRFRPADGYVYQIPFTWYGYGPTQFNFQMKKRLNDDWMATIGEIRPEGATSVVQPHLPVRCEVITGAGDGAFEARVSGRQVSVIGDYKPIFRQTSVEVEDASLVDIEWRPIVSVRRQSVYPYALTQLMIIDAVSAAPVRLAIVEDGPVPATGWTKPNDYATGLSLLEQNTTATTAYTDLSTVGNLLIKQRLSGGGQGNSMGGDDRKVSRMPMIEGRPFTIYGRLFPGATATDIHLTATFREDF